jgi:2-amino-4-hydroxy-6-hydroxymethyldihydropteridine diphosphokinase
MGPQDQPDYINAAALLETTLGPHALLDALQAVERAHHRVRERHWGPRTLDLDLLTFGSACLADARLTVPHPGLALRAFVVFPLAEIAPELEIPGLPAPGALRDHMDEAGIVRLARTHHQA